MGPASRGCRFCAHFASILTRYRWDPSNIRLYASWATVRWSRTIGHDLRPVNRVSPNSCAASSTLDRGSCASTAGNDPMTANNAPKRRPIRRGSRPAVRLAHTLGRGTRLDTLFNTTVDNIIHTLYVICTARANRCTTSRLFVLSRITISCV